MRTFIKIIAWIIFLVAFWHVGYAYRVQIGDELLTLIYGVKPCTQPITYRLGTFDDQFGISESDFRTIVAKATQVWDDALGRNLFTYSSTGDVAVNLIYDKRQQITDTLKSIDTSISNDTTNYSSLKNRYTNLTTAYDQAKANFIASVAAFNARKEALKNQIDMFNASGGMSQNQYQALRQEQSDLNTQALALTQQQDALNQSVATINQVADAINKVAGDVNSNVVTYNSVGSANSAEFAEGLYVQNGNDRHIDIYQFDTQARLQRVLTHEFGHALGLEHVDDPKAIMYRLNIGTSDKPTVADLAELAKACQI